LPTPHPWLCATILLAAAAPAAANELRVETRSVTPSAATRTLRVAAVVRWKNAWRNARNHDAAWLIVKLRGNPRGEWVHGKLVGLTPAAGARVTCNVARDQIGGFCVPAAAYRGDMAFQVVLEVQPNVVREQDIAAGTVEAQVIGLEMVYIPDGPFTIGDPDPRSFDAFAFYRSDAQGNHAGTLRITSEAAIPVGAQAGALYYKGSQYSGDRLGPVPETFPKGTQAFYVMKYEILQGQYATFLNLIPEYFASFRAPIGGRDYHEQRGSIYIENGRYVARSPDRPANSMSWDDGTAFADWAGLRPWTDRVHEGGARHG
jgi:hypothetical protein